MCGRTYVCEQLLWLVKRNKRRERLRLTDTNFSSIMKVSSAQDLKPEIRSLAACERCELSGKTEG
jgi:hypothetical protein